jgi:hypothetical protein
MPIVQQPGKGVSLRDTPYSARLFSSERALFACQKPGLVAITQWSLDCLSAGHSIYLPEVIDL